jgi:voltage-gated potassium channel
VNADPARSVTGWVPLGYALRRFYLALSVPVLLVGAGTAGYMAIEGWGLFDAVYMTVTTLTTVGFQEVHPLSRTGRAFTMGLVLVGVFSLFYAATAIIRAIVSGEVSGDLGRKRMERALDEMSDHVIVCGFGRMGRLVCGEFSTLKMPFVVVDRQEDLLESFRLPHGIPLVGDATSDGVLRRAGVGRARTLVTVAASDADNLYITMSARLLNEKLFIVARSEDEEAEKKLLRAGASRVVSPYVIGGQRVAQAVLRPAVVDFIELATRHDYLELQIEETRIEPGSALVGAPVKDRRLRQELGIIIVAIKRPDGNMLFNPEPEVVLSAGDVLITLGHRDQLDRLETLSLARGKA